ncbi:MAG: glycosyltransferase family 4 protein [Solirubrobacteraceae bacterium]
MNVCTIIAKNYLAYARVLARSFARHHPDGRFWTLIIDDFAGRIDPTMEPFEVLTPAEIECEPFLEMAMRYSVLELSTAVKPWLLRHIMSETGAPVTYLDPDIRIYESLNLLDELAASHGVVLIPHNNVPIPADGRKPSQVDIMIAGVYNLGYVTVAPGQEVDGLLDWWADRLRRDCRVDPVWGYFVDQRWFDLAPGFLSDVAIMREPEYNVAYWNLHARRLAYGEGRYSVDGRPLRFFHFSGFDPEHPLVLSRYQNRVDVLADPVLEQLLSEYATEVLDAGHQSSRSWAYGYTALGDGTPLDARVRTLYDRFAAERAEVPSPFTPDGASEFVHWLAQEAPGAPSGVSRVLASVYEERPDLRGAYPNLNGADRDRLLAWAQEYGRHEIPSLARTMMVAWGEPGPSGRTPASGDPAAPDRLSSNGAPAEAVVLDEPSEPLRNVEWGVNVVGYFRSELGMGEAARQLVSALETTGIPVLPIHGNTIPLSRQGHAYETATPADAVFPVNLICMNADALPEFAGQVGNEFFAGRYSVGLWFWEVGLFPSRWVGSFSLLEEVWAPTEHVAAALEPVATVPAHTVRIPVQAPAFEPRSREDLGLPEDQFVFLFSFDYLSVFKRKNPLAVIEAFARAFVPGEGAHLVLKCINHERDSPAHAELCDAAARHADITVIDRYMSPSDKNALTALCDCYVSLHRAEGFGLPMAEAMSLEKPVIATGYSGNLDFMTDSNSLLVDYQLIPIGPGAEPYPAEGEWADPDVEHASTLMRRLFDDPAGARELGARGATDIARTHSPEAAGMILHRRLESIRATGRARRAVDQARMLPPALAALPLRIRQGPVRPSLGKAGTARELARNTALRAMRPFVAYQQTVNFEIVSALEELNGLLADLRTEAAADRARLLRELRINRGAPTEMQQSAIGEIERILQLQTDRGLYAALAELRHRHAAITAQPGGPGEVPDLTGYELRAFSQNGEDGVLAEILRRIGAPTRSFVEFGVESGREGNCVYLADVGGWRGVFMEADDEFYDALASKYAAQARIRAVQARITPENVESTFGQAGVVPEPDVLSVDVDGQDYWIWEAVENYRPRVVVVEYNSALDPRRRLVQPNEPSREWDGSEFFGASLGALQLLGDKKGYQLVHTELSGVNAFFVRSDLVGEAFPESEHVARRGTPNYFQAGYRHPSARAGWRYLDLDTGQFVDSKTL